MKNRHVLISVLGPVLVMSAHAAVSSDGTGSAGPTVQVPNTVAAHKSVKLISRAERAMRGYVAACISGQAQALSRVTTPDLRIEYALDEPGTYLSTDASSLPANCAALGGRDARVSNLWIFPTHDAGSVFVQYEAQTATDASPHQQLALIEMRGNRIARMLNFAALPPSVMASTGTMSTAASPCAHQRDEMKAERVSTSLSDGK